MKDYLRITHVNFKITINGTVEAFRAYLSGKPIYTIFDGMVYLRDSYGITFSEMIGMPGYIYTIKEMTASFENNWLWLFRINKQVFRAFDFRKEVIENGDTVELTLSEYYSDHYQPVRRDERNFDELTQEEKMRNMRFLLRTGVWL